MLAVMLQNTTEVNCMVIKTLLLLRVPSANIISILGIWSFARSASFTALCFQSEHLLACHSVLCTPTLICSSLIAAPPSLQVTKLYKP